MMIFKNVNVATVEVKFNNWYFGAHYDTYTIVNCDDYSKNDILQAVVKKAKAHTGAYSIFDIESITLTVNDNTISLYDVNTTPRFFYYDVTGNNRITVLHLDDMHAKFLGLDLGYKTRVAAYKAAKESLKISEFFGL